MKARDASQATKNRMDEETAEFYNRVREAYFGIAEREPERFQVIEASGSVESIHENVVEIVTNILK